MHNISLAYECEWEREAEKLRFSVFFCIAAEINQMRKNARLHKKRESKAC